MLNEHNLNKLCIYFDFDKPLHCSHGDFSCMSDGIDSGCVCSCVLKITFSTLVKII